MIHALAAETLPALLERLARTLRAVEADPFLPIRLVVPSPGVRAWLQLALARRLGIACNLRLDSLDAFFASLIPAERSGLRVLRSDLLASAILRVLEDPERTQDPACAGLQAYLQLGSRGDAVLRRAQLATALAKRFRDYSLSRPELLEAWGAKRTTLPADHESSSVEAWQAEVWRAVFGSERALTRGGPEPQTHVEVTRLFQALPVGDSCAPPRVHVFGFAHFAEGYRGLLSDLAQRSEVHLYLLGPPPADRVNEGRGSSVGALGASFARAWEELALADPQRVRFERLAPVSRAPSLLTLAQALLADRQPPLAAELQAGSCASLELLACPSRAREVEVVAGKIWGQVRQSSAAGDPLRFDQVGVAVADSQWEAYRNRIRASFQAAEGIPLSFLDQAGLGENRVAEAARLLLELPLGDFSRDDLLRFLIHPALQVHLPDVDPQEWLGWCEELRVLRGVEPGDHQGTYVERDLYTFGQGARRLALGAFLDASHGAPILTLAGQPYLTHEIAPGQLTSAAQFLLLVRSLTADLRFARQASLSLKDWSAFLRALLRTYLDPDGSAPAGLGRLRGKLARLEALDLDGRELPFGVAFSLASAQIEAPRTPRAQPLCGGVVAGPLSAMAGLPFRSLYVMGLDERAFPAQGGRSLLDLRRATTPPASPWPAEPQPGERDLLAFARAVAGAGESLSLSYLARDETTGEALAPSSVLRDLGDALVGHGVPEARLWTRPPLRRYAASAFAPPLGSGEGSGESPREGRREARARALQGTLAAHLPPGAPWPEARELAAHLAPAARARLQPLFGLARPEPQASRPSSEGALRLPLTSLREFLQSPLQAWGKHRLGFREASDSDLLAQVDEPFSTSVMDATLLLRSAFYDALAQVPEGESLEEELLEAAFDARVLRAELEGRLPTGVFLRVERRRHVGVLHAWRRNLVRHFDAATLRGLRVYRFGAATRQGASDVLEGPIELELELGGAGGAGGATTRVRLHGSTLPVLPGFGGTVQLVLARRASRRHVWRGFLDHAILAAAGHTCEGPYQAVVSPGSWANLEHPKHYRGFAAYSREEARDYLGLLVRDFLGGPHEVAFPLEVTLPYVEEWHREGAAPGDLARRIRASRDDDWSKNSDDYGPVPQPGRFAPPAEGDALAWSRISPVVTRRLDPEGTSQ